MADNGNQIFECLLKEAQLGIEEIVSEAFSGVLGFSELPACVSDTATLRFKMIVGGQSPTCIDPMLRQALVIQLETGQHFARVWTQAQPELDELVTVWQAQTEVTQRWQVLPSLLEGKTDPCDIEEAYRFALERYPYQKLDFRLDEERACVKASESL